MSLEIKRCVQKWIITFQPHSSAFWSHCQEKEEEEEPAFFYLFSCLCVAFVWLAQLCNEKVYERTAFTPDKCVRSVAERERGLSLLKIVTSSQMPGKSFQVLSLCEMLHMVKLIPLSRIALFVFFSLSIMLFQHKIICRPSENNSGSPKIHQGQQFVFASPR